jgi:ferredoxin
LRKRDESGRMKIYPFTSKKQSISLRKIFMAKGKDEGKKIVVDSDLCIGCGTCISIAPAYFEFNEEGKSKVKKKYDPADEGLIQEAIGDCPSDAISLS